MQYLRHVAGAAAGVEDSGAVIRDVPADQTGCDRDVGVTAGPELLIVVAGPFVVKRCQGPVFAIGLVDPLQPGFEVLHKNTSCMYR